MSERKSSRLLCNASKPLTFLLYRAFLTAQERLLLWSDSQREANVTGLSEGPDARCELDWLVFWWHLPTPPQQTAALSDMELNDHT